MPCLERQKIFYFISYYTLYSDNQKTLEYEDDWSCLFYLMLFWVMVSRYWTGLFTKHTKQVWTVLQQDKKRLKIFLIYLKKKIFVPKPMRNVEKNKIDLNEWKKKNKRRKLNNHSISPANNIWIFKHLIKFLPTLILQSVIQVNKILLKRTCRNF